MKTETIEDFLARGGKIQKCANGPTTYDHSSKYKKDSQLHALRQLKKQANLSDTDKLKIDRAISARIQILKTTF
jgi:hypothetical protein